MNGADMTPPGAEGRDARVEHAHATFQRLIGVAEDLLRRGRFRRAAAAAQIAGLYAAYNHPGEFASARLEEVLRRIGLHAVAPTPEQRRREPGEPQRVLHVLTAAKDIGGDSRFVWRWIERDPARCCSVALTQQMIHRVPEELTRAVAASGGGVHALDRAAADIVGQARRLRQLAERADAVFLHVYPEDVLPAIAFADRRGLPPIAYVVQADHQFWLGVGACDVFVHLRDSGAALSAVRRGIPPERSALLPIPLEPVARRLSPADARRQLGLPESSVVLLTIARAVKYTPIAGPSFAEIIEPVLRQHPEAVLLAVGPDQTGIWNDVAQRTGNRLRALGQRSDTAVFYEAADVYLDSFPFASNTSLLEAGGRGLPLVGYAPFSPEADVLGPGTPALERVLSRPRTIADYQQALSALIADPALRAKLGDRTRQEISAHHSPPGWHRHLDHVYRLVGGPLPPAGAATTIPPMRCGEADVLLHRFYAGHAPLGWVIGWYARRLPYADRVALLVRLLRIDRTFSFGLFLPERVTRALAAHVSGWRRWPVVSRWLVASSQ